MNSFTLSQKVGEHLISWCRCSSHLGKEEGRKPCRSRSVQRGTGVQMGESVALLLKTSKQDMEYPGAQNWSGLLWCSPNPRNAGLEGDVWVAGLRCALGRPQPEHTRLDGGCLQKSWGNKWLARDLRKGEKAKDQKHRQGPRPAVCPPSPATSCFTASSTAWWARGSRGISVEAGEDPQGHPSTRGSPPRLPAWDTLCLAVRCHPGGKRSGKVPFWKRETQSR